MKYLFILMATIFSFSLSQNFNQTADAEVKRGYFYDKDGVIPAGTNIIIKEYSPELDGVFEVQTDEDYGANSYYTRIGDLMTASKKIKRSSFKRKPRSLQDKKFVLDKDLVVYTYPIDID